SGYAASNAASAAMLVVRIAGCAFLVRSSSCSGPSKHRLEMEKPSARSARSKISLARWLASLKALPMPTDCEPCPGNSHATLKLVASSFGGVCAGGFEHGATLVVAASRTHAVRQRGCRAAGAGDHVGRSHLVVIRAPHVTSARSMTSFRSCHGAILSFPDEL